MFSLGLVFTEKTALKFYEKWFLFYSTRIAMQAHENVFILKEKSQLRDL